MKTKKVDTLKHVQHLLLAWALPRKAIYLTNFLLHNHLQGDSFVLQDGLMLCHLQKQEVKFETAEQDAVCAMEQKNDEKKGLND